MLQNREHWRALPVRDTLRTPNSWLPKTEIEAGGAPAESADHACHVGYFRESGILLLYSAKTSAPQMRDEKPV